MVDYDRNKIMLAIRKANAVVGKEEALSEDKIEQIIASIEALEKGKMQVEEIQDIIEQKLMEEGKFTLAKSYTERCSRSV